MGVGAGLYMYVVVVQKFTFAISSPDEFLYLLIINFIVFSSEKEGIYIPFRSVFITCIKTPFPSFLFKFV